MEMAWCHAGWTWRGPADARRPSCVPPGTRTIRVTLNRGPPAPGYFRRALRARDETHRDVSAGWQRTNASLRGNALPGPTCCRQRGIPEGCMTLAGGRWPPDCRPPQKRIPEGCMEMAWCHAGWTWRGPADARRPSCVPPGTRTIRVTLNRGPPAPGYFRRALRARDEAHRDVSAGWQRTNASLRGNALPGPTCCRQRGIPEGCMTLAGGRWPPDCRPPQKRIPEGCMEMAWCHAGWTWRGPADARRPSCVPPGTRAIRVTLNRGPPAHGYFRRALRARDEAHRDVSAGWQRTNASLRGNALPGPTCCRQRGIPEGCMTLAGGRWPPECPPPQKRIPEGCMVLAGGRWPPECRTH